MYNLIQIQRCLFVANRALRILVVGLAAVRGCGYYYITKKKSAMGIITTKSFKLLTLLSCGFTQTFQNHTNSMFRPKWRSKCDLMHRFPTSDVSLWSKRATNKLQGGSIRGRSTSRTASPLAEKPNCHSSEKPHPNLRSYIWGEQQQQSAWVTQTDGNNTLSEMLLKGLIS